MLLATDSLSTTSYNSHKQPRFARLLVTFVIKNSCIGINCGETLFHSSITSILGKEETASKLL